MTNCFRIYEYDVTDFLCPNTPRFLKTIEKIKKTLVGETTVKNDDYIFIKSDSKLVQIKLEDIHWVEVENYMRLHTDKEKHTVYTMKEIESKLPTKDFIKFNDLIVRLDKILSIEDNYVIMKIRKFTLEKHTKIIQ